VQAARGPHLLDAIAVRPEQPRELVDAGLFGAAGCSGMERATDVQHIDAIEAAGLRDCRDAGALPECLRNRSRFAAPRGGARPGDDGNLSQHHGRILHENAIGVLLQGWQPLQTAAERLYSRSRLQARDGRCPQT